MTVSAFPRSALLLLGALVLALQPALAALDVAVDATPLDRSSSGALTSYAPFLKQASPGVVSVYTARVVRVVRGGQALTPQEEMLRRFFGLPVPTPQEPGEEPRVEERRMPQGVGSGVIISANGYILTNNHVVSDESGEDADEVLVRTGDGRELPATIVGRDERTDIAVLKVEADNLPIVTLANSDAIEVGDIVFAIGNPLGVGLTVTQGIISATQRTIGIYGEEGYEDFIQTDASINMGNSGGALVDARGRLIGINSAILSRTGGNIGIGFAIPANLALGIANQLVDSGEVRRGYLGVTTSDLTPEMAEAFGIDSTDGALVNRVEEGSPADRAGIERGDILVSIDGKPVTSSYQLRLRVGQLLPGSSIQIQLIREGEKKTLTANLTDRDLAGAGGNAEWIEGVRIASLTDETRESYRIPEDINGVLITAVEPSSGYGRFLREGMVLMEINDRRVANPQQARDSLRRGINKLYVFERGTSGYLALRLR